MVSRRTLREGSVAEGEVIVVSFDLKSCRVLTRSNKDSIMKGCWLTP